MSKSRENLESENSKLKSTFVCFMVAEIIIAIFIIVLIVRVWSKRNKKTSSILNWLSGTSDSGDVNDKCTTCEKRYPLMEHAQIREDGACKFGGKHTNEFRPQSEGTVCDTEGKLYGMIHGYNPRNYNPDCNKN